MVVEVKDFTHGESAEKKSRFRPKCQGFFSEIKFSVLCRLCEAEVTSRLFPPCCTEIKNARRRLPSGVEKSKAMEQKRFELSTPTLRTWCSSQLSYCPENNITILLISALSRKQMIFSLFAYQTPPKATWHPDFPLNSSDPLHQTLH